MNTKLGTTHCVNIKHFTIWIQKSADLCTTLYLCLVLRNRSQIARPFVVQWAEYTMTWIDWITTYQQYETTTVWRVGEWFFLKVPTRHVFLHGSLWTSRNRSEPSIICLQFYTRLWTRRDRCHMVVDWVQTRAPSRQSIFVKSSSCQ